ncbi:hypothetical protein ACN28I_40120 [Archangium gephyra]|uniref:hypothetical protein n=1 Tax=Archangium gephyra TaxID=48 RepID=UPI003B82AE36
MPPISINAVSGWLAALLNAERTDWVANECLANNPKYAKPDAEKQFALWEAQGPSIEITAIEGLEKEHPWLLRLFVIDGTKGQCKVRFPYNIWDSAVGMSICPDNLVAPKTTLLSQQVRVLRRWSSASRSCFTLIPSELPEAADNVSWDAERRPNGVANAACVNQVEWSDARRASRRFATVVGGDLGKFCGPEGRTAAGDASPSRLYSVKTGVSYVGSAFEEPFKKNVLEANSEMAIVRSSVIRKVEQQRPVRQRDDTYRVQIELLTITALCEIDGTERRDGFQVRDLSCMRDGEAYIPGHAIPYNGGAFSGRDGAEDCQFWLENFALPCGRAKARMFLDYGLIHSSANAQNFIVGFNGAEFAGFILRDIGDTYWHDDYIKDVLGTGHPAYTGGVSVERAKAHKHLLHVTTSQDYPAPHLVRIAAYSVITHGFADELKKNRNWQDRDILRFTQAILTGFRDYCARTIGFPGEYPRRELDYALDPLQMGKTFAYPSGKYTQQQAETFLKNHAEDALAVAGHIRRHSEEILARAADKQKALEALIHAEEMALCAAIELYLRNTVQARKLTPNPGVLNWWGSASKGLQCGTCQTTHGTIPSSAFHRWHLCVLCGRYYCSSCGAKLRRGAYFARARVCECGGQTTLID